MEPRAQRLANVLKAEGITHPNVLEAVANTPRHVFVPDHMQDSAYDDHALPIGDGQTISQPFVVARMTELILNGEQTLDNVLEIGTGSGYQAAILSCIAKEVYTIERIENLHAQVSLRFKALDYSNIHLLLGDGYLGWPEHAPYEAIIVTAAAPYVPDALKAQLADGGRMIIPIGEQHMTQQLTLITRTGDDYEQQGLDPVVFVPMLGGID
jgi:protein-L-isoaspartate(D-aspartate) O-methyltransferase